MYLVLALMDRTVARRLRLESRSRNLAGELSTLFGCVQSDDFILNDYYPLIRLVLNDASTELYTPLPRYVYQKFLRITARERIDAHPYRTTYIHYYIRILEAKNYD